MPLLCKYRATALALVVPTFVFSVSVSLLQIWPTREMRRPGYCSRIAATWSRCVFWISGRMVSSIVPKITGRSIAFASSSLINESAGLGGLAVVGGFVGLDGLGDWISVAGRAAYLVLLLPKLSLSCNPKATPFICPAFCMFNTLDAFIPLTPVGL